VRLELEYDVHLLEHAGDDLDAGLIIRWEQLHRDPPVGERG
jgi:hypothetical protein